MVDGRPAQRVGVTVQQCGDRRGPMPWVVPVDQGAAVPVGDRHRQATHRRGHHRRAAGLRLDGDQAEGFRVARHRHQVSSTIDVHQVLTGLRRQERHPVGDGQVVGQPHQAVGCGQATAGGPAGDHDPNIRRQQGRSAQQYVGSLQWLDTTDERQDPLAGGQPQRTASRRPVTR